MTPRRLSHDSPRRPASVALNKRSILALATRAMAGWDTHQLPEGCGAEHSTSGTGGGEQPQDDFRALSGAGLSNGCGKVAWHHASGCGRGTKAEARGRGSEARGQKTWWRCRKRWREPAAAIGAGFPHLPCYVGWRKPPSLCLPSPRNALPNASPNPRPRAQSAFPSRPWLPIAPTSGANFPSLTPPHLR